MRKDPGFAWHEIFAKYLLALQIAGNFFNIFISLSAFDNDDWQIVFSSHPEYKILHILYAALSCFLVWYVIKVRKGLLNFESGGVERYYKYALIQIIAPALYRLMPYFSNGSSYGLEQGIIYAVLGVLFFGGTAIYYKRRRYLFVNKQITRSDGKTEFMLNPSDIMHNWEGYYNEDPENNVEKPVSEEITDFEPIEEKPIVEQASFGKALKYCRFCGNAIPEDSMFCEHCGSKLALDTSQMSDNKKSNDLTPSVESTKKKSNTGKKIAGWLLAIALIGLVGFIGYQYYCDSTGEDPLNLFKQESNIEEEEEEVEETAEQPEENIVLDTQYTTVGDTVTIQVTEIIPIHALYSHEDDYYSYYVCQCKLTSGKYALMLFDKKTYKSRYDFFVQDEVEDTFKGEAITYNPYIELSGTVIRTDDLMDGLSETIGSDTLIDHPSEA